MNYLLFDTETTALLKSSAANDSDQPQVIEFYGRLCDDQGRLLEELDLLIDPGVPLDQDIQRITGLNDAMLAGKPNFAAVAHDIDRLIGKSHVVVAHNLAFDFQVVTIEMHRVGIERPSWPIGRCCTVEQTEHLTGKRLSLTKLHEHLFGEGFPQAHRAKNDVLALHRCFFHLLRTGEI